jgi:cytochrome c oxidase cbb3-type subunit 3
VSTQDPTQDKVVHVYDDIMEEDNHLPNWWLAILIGSIVFGFGYWFVYHTAKLRPTPAVAYRSEVEKLVAARIAANPTSPEAIVALAKDNQAMAEGRQVFMTTCAACHGQRGEGIIGPNLTDNRWIHGYGPGDIFKAASEGFPTKGMPAWGAIIGPDRTRKAAAYVLTLKNTNVAGGKAPQGEIVE